MKKPICIILFLFGMVRFSVAQTTTLEIYSSKKFWESDKVKNGVGFKFRNTIFLKQPYLFIIYKDHITFKGKQNITYKVNKIESQYQDSVHYLVSDSNGQSFTIIIDDNIIDSKHYSGITIIKTGKDGRDVAVTRYDVKKQK